MGFPLDAETITPLTDGVDYEEASNVNNPVAKLANIVSFLGAAGNAQSKLAALNRLFKYMLNPLPKVTWIDIDTIEIAPCVMLMHSGNNYVIKENTSALQIVLSADLDTGSEAATTVYDVFLVGDGASSVYTAKFVVQGNTPNGATYYKKIFHCINDASSNLIAFRHNNKSVELDDYSVASVLSSGAPSAATWTDVNLANFVPRNCRARIIGHLVAGYSSVDANFRIMGSSATKGTSLLSGGQANSDNNKNSSDFLITPYYNSGDGTNKIQYVLSSQSGSSNALSLWVAGFELDDIT